MESYGDDDTSAMLRGARAVVSGRGVIALVGLQLAATEDELRRRIGRERYDAQVALGASMDADQLLTFVGERVRRLLQDDADS